LHLLLANKFFEDFCFHHFIFVYLTIANMAHVFNICFQHKGKSYTALVSINGKEDSPVKVATNSDSIQILLPTGQLIFSIADVLQRLYAVVDKSSANATFYVTPTISLQLMNADW
jgi:hypothetical protein